MKRTNSTTKINTIKKDKAEIQTQKKQATEKDKKHTPDVTNNNDEESLPFDEDNRKEDDADRQAQGSDEDDDQTLLDQDFYTQFQIKHDSQNRREMKLVVLLTGNQFLTLCKGHYWIAFHPSSFRGMKCFADRDCRNQLSKRFRILSVMHITNAPFSS
jgi:hypothetical protein